MYLNRITYIISLHFILCQLSLSFTYFPPHLSLRSQMCVLSSSVRPTKLSWVSSLLLSAWSSTSFQTIQPGIILNLPDKSSGPWPRLVRWVRCQPSCAPSKIMLKRLTVMITSQPCLWSSECFCWDRWCQQTWPWSWGTPQTRQRQPLPQGEVMGDLLLLEIGPWPVHLRHDCVRNM